MLEELGETSQTPPQVACAGVTGQPCAIYEQFIHTEQASDEGFA